MVGSAGIGDTGEFGWVIVAELGVVSSVDGAVEPKNGRIVHSLIASFILRLLSSSGVSSRDGN